MKILKYIFATLPLLGALSGCMKDAPTTENSAGDGKVLISLRMPSLSTAGGTRGTVIPEAPAFEHKISDYITVLVFEDKGGDGYSDKFLYSTTPTLTAQDPDTPNVFTYSLPIHMSESGVRQRLVFLLNFESQYAEFHAGLTPGMTKAEILGSLTYTYAGSRADYYWWEAWHGGFPMWGESPNSVLVTVNTQGGAFGNIEMNYAVAKIEIAVGANSTYTEANGIENFKLAYAGIHNSLSKGYVAPQPGSAYDKTTGFVTAPAVPSDASTTPPDNILLPVKDHTFPGSSDFPYLHIDPMYVVEHDNKNSTHADRMFIVLGGYYTAPGEPENVTTKTYYRIDFRQTSPDGTVTPYDILRSHRYLVNITSASGPGFPTEEEAANSISTNMSARIDVWSDSEVVAVLEQGRAPEYVLEVDRYYPEDPGSAAYWTFDGEAHGALSEENWINIRTDFEGGWQSWAVNVDDNGGESAMHYGMTGTWLWLDPSNGSGFMGGELACIHTTAYDGLIPRRGRIYIQAGKWIFTINVEQKKEITIDYTERTISFMSHINGPMGHNEFKLNASIYDIGSIEFEDTPWDFEAVIDEDHNNQFYVQSSANTGYWPRTAIVPVRVDRGDGTFKTFRVKVTQDVAECGMGGIARPMVFDTTPGAAQPTVMTHLVGGNPREYIRKVEEIRYHNGQPFENWSDSDKKSTLLNFSYYPSGDNYACWMVENSSYGTYTTTTYGTVSPDIYTGAGPYYSYEQARHACPPGWRLPNYADIFGMAQLYAASQLYGTEMDVQNEMNAAIAFIKSADTYPGFYGYEGSSVNWHGWESKGYFPSSSNSSEITKEHVVDYLSQYPDLFTQQELDELPETQHLWGITPNHVLYAAALREDADGYGDGIDLLANGFFFNIVNLAKESNPLSPVRCVKDVIYHYE